MNNTILITGGTGFAGSHLIELLLKHGESSVHVTTNTAVPALIQDWLSPEQIHTVDLLDRAATTALIEQLQPRYIYHLAALAEVGSSFDQAEKILTNNLILQLNILEALRKVSPETRILIVGSGQEYDVFHPSVRVDRQPITEDHPLGPSNPYAVSKVGQDLLALSYHYSYQLDIVRVRPFNHIGERQSPNFAVPSFAQQIALIEIGKQTELKVGNMSAERDMTDVKDVVRAYHLVMLHGQTGSVYNVGSGSARTMQDILDELTALAQCDIPVTVDPTRFRPIDIPTISADISKIRQLGWKPEIPLDTTLQRVLRYWRDQVNVV